MTRNFLVLFFVLLGVGCSPRCEKSPFMPLSSTDDTPPDFRIEHLSDGSGPVIQEGDIVTVHFRCWLYHKENAESKGPLVNDTYAIHKPLTIRFGEDELIDGWQQGLHKAKIGDKLRLFIPSVMAYGDEGAGNSIPRGAHLIYEIEILSASPRATENH